MSKFEEFVKKVESYCHELGGRFERVRARLGCWNVERAPDPRRLINLLKESRDIYREEGTDISIYFITDEQSLLQSRGNLEVGVDPYKVYLYLEKWKGEYPQAWEMDMREAVRRLNSVVDTYRSERDWSVYRDEGKNYLQLHLSQTWREWDESDWDRLERVLEKARRIFEWKGTMEQITKRTTGID